MTSPRFSFMRWLPWILLTIGLFAFWKWQNVAPPVSYTTAAITRGALEDAVTASGSLQASEYVDVGTQVSGVLQKLFVELGQTVKKGDPLAEIDPSLFQAKLDQDEATLKNLQAQLDASGASLKLAELRYTRNKNLMKHNAVSQDDLDNSETNFSRAKASIESLKAQIENAKASIEASQANLSHTKIFAPMSGTVVEVQAREGQTLNASQTAPILFRLANLHLMTVDAQVSEADIQRIKVGMPVYFTTLGDPDTHHNGMVRVIEPESASSNPPVFYDTLFDVKNDNQSLMPLMTAQVFFPMSTKTNVMIMPIAALDYAKHQHPEASQKPKGKKAHPTKVFVLRDDGPVEVEVTLGMSNRVSVEVVSGLKNDDEVITGSLDIRPNASPRVMIR